MLRGERQNALLPGSAGLEQGVEGQRNRTVNPALRLVAHSAASSEAREDALALQLARQLDRPASELSHEVSERLRAARVRAVDARKRTASVRPARAGASQRVPERLGWLGWVGSLVPAFALVVGLTLLHDVQNEHRASEVAEVDSALLLDTLPPGAYSDPGFAQYLRLEADAAE
ncbi:MAG: DUF3619 family protein [Betaproteobacteria bacterium]|nr:DUF3619 family protein [Betaproteobacteria bacterium]